MTKRVFEIEGKGLDCLEAFFDEVGRKLGTAPWGRNLDAFNDILRGGFGTPDGGFVLRWKDSDRSKQSLGYAATLHYLEQLVRSCHPDNAPSVKKEIEAARRYEGPTLFDVLIEIIRCHGPGGDEAEDGVELELQ